MHVNEIAVALQRNLGKNTALHRHPNARWTIAGADVRIFYPRSRSLELTRESTDGGSVLVTTIPGVDDLRECWSNSADDLYTLESGEILEKCLLWNCENALESWRLAR